MAVETMQFKTEVNKLLELMIHSLYSHKEIFLRELISNASDAIDKCRYAALTDDALYEGEKNFRVKLIADKDAGTLTISDNGIGMNHDEVIQALGTIAHSGTKEFMKLLENKKNADTPELIGQFGVGFYSAFMVADKVTVITRKAGGNEPAVKWESTADGTFTVDAAEKAGKGTDVILTLKEDEKEYLNDWKLREVVKKYSDFIEYPVVMDVTRPKSNGEEDSTETVTEEETLNSMKAIWLKDKADVTAEEYKQFYQHVTHDWEDPQEIIHYRAEGTTEFSVLAYIPKRAPFDLFYKEYKMGLMLYVKRVQIMDACEGLLPPYLRFVKGVVESSDLPLNVSREILQNNKMIGTMKKNITKKVLGTLEDMKKNDYDKYLEFHKEFGRVLKEGIHFDFERKEQIADLMLMESTATEKGKYTTFAEYVERMKEGQEDIYYITGTTRVEAENSPYLEAFRKKGYEVLIMTDEIDDIILGGLHTYKEKSVKSVIKGDIDLGDTSKEEKQKEYKELLDLLKEALKDEVSDVRVSGRLTDSAVCLVGGENDLDPQMEKIMQAMGQAVPSRKRVLELNPDHALVKGMFDLFGVQKESPVLKQYATLLYDSALLLEGDRPKDPAAFTKAMADLMARGLKM